jgi:hypothetical protein
VGALHPHPHEASHVELSSRVSGEEIEALFTGGLGLQAPRVVESVNLEFARRRVDVEVGRLGPLLDCSQCGAPAQPVYDGLRRSL